MTADFLNSAASPASARSRRMSRRDEGPRLPPMPRTNRCAGAPPGAPKPEIPRQRRRKPRPNGQPPAPAGEVAARNRYYVSAANRGSHAARRGPPLDARLAAAHALADVLDGPCR